MNISKLIILSLVFTYVVSVFVYKSILPSQQFCLTDDIPKHTLVKVDLKSEGDIKFEFKEGIVPIFTLDVQRMAFTRSFTTQRYGNHLFCFTNSGSYESRIGIQISIGKQAGDFGSAVEGDDLMGALQNQARIAQQFIQDIVKQNTEGMQIMVHESSYQNHQVYYILFSVFFGAAAIFLTFLQYRVITKHLHARKYI